MSVSPLGHNPTPVFLQARSAGGFSVGVSEALVMPE
jgi:hypothetical protein